MILALVVLHFLLGAVASPLYRWLGRRVFIVMSAAPAATVVWVAVRAGDVRGGRAVTESWNWVEGLGVDVTFRVDAFSLLMAGIVSGVGVLVFLYSAQYFGARVDLGRVAGLLTAFAGSMLGLVVADNVLGLFVFWELTTITSYLLIGGDGRRAEARAAALQAFLVTALGGLAMLGGFVLIAQQAGTYSLSAIVASRPDGTLVTVGLVLVLVGALTKSAQFPFQQWLPGAMAAPTPISAYLHSATMVKAGVYLIARLAPGFATTVPFRPLVVTLGVITMLLGGARALAQTDLKLLLAYGTVSQLGLMCVLFGTGTPFGVFAGTALLLAHALFKSALFLVVGIIDHQAGTRDLRRLSQLSRLLPATFAVAVLAGASMAGLPPLLGFVAKEEAIDALLHNGSPAWSLALAGVLAGSALTVAYTFRFLWGAFGSRALDEPGRVKPAAWVFVAPAAVTASLSLVSGIAPGLAGWIVSPASGALDPRAGTRHLVLWHGFTLPLGLSAVAIAVGLAIGLGLGRRLRIPAAWTRGVNVYPAAIRGLTHTADRLTGVVQSGSLPIYVMIILLTVLLIPGVALVTNTRLPSGVVAAESPLQWVVAGIVAAAAGGVAVARRRFGAVILLGAVGYGVALLFVIQGGPDLALTQVLVETVAVVAFVLVLRHLPDRFETAPARAWQAARIAISLAIGAMVTVFALVAASARTQPLVSDSYVAGALPEAGGRNVVNVILVDFRGFDTLGEITVIATAAMGVASLVLLGRRREEAL